MDKNQAFVTAICTQADKAFKEGQPALLNRVAGQPSVKHYYDNVFKLKALTHEQWVRDYPAQAADVNALREAYDAEQAQTERISKLFQQVEGIESKLERLTGLIEGMVEAAPKAKVKAAPKTESVTPPAEKAEVSEYEELEAKDE